MDTTNIIKNTETGMQDSVKHLEKAFTQIRAGRANPNMLGNVMVDYYGSPTPLSQVANVSAPDAMTLNVQPWEATMIQPIEKAIMEANLGFNPSNNGNAVIISVPPLTEERRKDLVKQTKTELENAKVSIRNWRKEANNSIKKSDDSEDLQKSLEANVQELTDKYIKIAEELFTKKEAEIMKV
ncbi:ribosome recycling factor [Candidatus Ornithobacterium hominis]|uniref:ribosome recycling factor n=1 Tax=Candidatus Ornithobacterium hominis TaxID=2497989 RepID=UPI0024BC8CEE|nr:ribosome recycling factor [Candidatus Ornithobacterium hominis]CAI9429744.1 ribosome recycling factor [Candidatus Ornithobacterium hominis]